MSKLWVYSTLMFSGSIFAGSFVDNSSVELTTRNFYFDRDYQELSKYPAAKDWTQAIPKEQWALVWIFSPPLVLSWMPAPNMQELEIYRETPSPMNPHQVTVKSVSRVKLKLVRLNLK